MCTRGFSLIELLVVIGIIAVLIGYLVPSVPKDAYKYARSPFGNTQNVQASR